MAEIEPLSKDEQDIVIEAAKEAGRVTVHERSIDVYALVIFFLDTGAHPCVLAEKDKRQLKITEERGQMFLEWKRPKKKGKDAHTVIPVSARLKPIIHDFIGQDLPRYRKYYNDALEVIRNMLKIKLGEPEPTWLGNVCPLGFRHSFGVNRIDDGFPETKVSQLMNCSSKTLKTYIRYSKTMLTDKGW